MEFAVTFTFASTCVWFMVFVTYLMNSTFTLTSLRLTRIPMWRMSLTALIGLVTLTLTFDLYIGSQVTCLMCFHHANFGLPRPNDSLHTPPSVYRTTAYNAIRP